MNSRIFNSIWKALKEENIDEISSMIDQKLIPIEDDTLLLPAAISGNLKMLILLGNFFDLSNIRDNYTRNNLLYAAINRQNVEMVKYLIEKTNEMPILSLKLALERRNSDIVNLLFENNWDIHRRIEDLLLAVNTCSFSFCLPLLNRTCDKMLSPEIFFSLLESSSAIIRLWIRHHWKIPANSDSFLEQIVVSNNLPLLELLFSKIDNKTWWSSYNYPPSRVLLNVTFEIQSLFFKHYQTLQQLDILTEILQVKPEYDIFLLERSFEL
jgi:hypothetical protein